MLLRMADPPRITRAEAITPQKIRERMYDIERENDRVLSDLDACERERDRLLEQNRNLVAEWNRMNSKLRQFYGYAEDDEALDA